MTFGWRQQQAAPCRLCHPAEVAGPGACVSMRPKPSIFRDHRPQTLPLKLRFASGRWADSTHSHVPRCCPEPATNRPLLPSNRAYLVTKQTGASPDAADSAPSCWACRSGSDAGLPPLTFAAAAAAAAPCNTWCEVGTVKLDSGQHYRSKHTTKLLGIEEAGPSKCAADLLPPTHSPT